jgi:hypothetical protein
MPNASKKSIPSTFFFYILIYYLHSCVYFINISAISAPGKQNVNVTAPVVYTSGLNSISLYRKVRLIEWTSPDSGVLTECLTTLVKYRIKLQDVYQYSDKE